MEVYSFTLIIGALFAWILFLWLLRLRHKTLPYPPGPSGYPLVGYVKKIPDPIWKTYRDWSREYNSSMIGYKALGTNIIVVNAVDTANDLLDRWSSIYSDRSTVGLTMSYELVGFSWSSALAPYGQYWRDSRKLLQQTFNSQASRQYRGIQTTAVRRLLRNILGSPRKFRDHTRYMMGEAIVRGSYGIEVQEKNDPYIAIAERALRIANQTILPGRWLVDVLPILKYVPEWVPGAGFKRQARLWRDDVMAMTDTPFRAVKDRDDLPEDCAVKHMLENIDRNYEDGETLALTQHIKDSLATVYSAGSDTTTSTIDTFILAMTLFPEIQREAQKAVDQVCEGRLPEYSDYDAIPYVHALVRECLRWRPAVPLAVPHMVTEDDVYKGYFIPAKSIIFPNVKAMLLDPDNYPDPEHFSPARFLKKSGSTSGSAMELDASVTDPSTIVFGFGRRTCPGRWFAYDSLWISVASLLATFDIRQIKDVNGRSVAPQGGYIDTFISYPDDFECVITPRSNRHEVLVTSAPT